MTPGPAVTIEAIVGVGGPWFDMTCDVVAARIRRGRTTGGPQAWMNRINSGELVLTLDNNSGRYSQFDTELNNVLLSENTYVRIRAHWKGTDYCIGGYYIEQWREIWTKEGTDHIEITAVDALAFMVEQGGLLEWVPGVQGQTVPKRIEQLLIRGGQRGVPFYGEDNDFQVSCISPLLQGVSLLDELHVTALSENGVVFHEPQHKITDVTDVTHDDTFVYLGPSRFMSVLEAPGAKTAAVAEGTNAEDWHQVTGTLARAVGTLRRPAQTKVPVFSDNCIFETDTLPYVDIEWKYVGYERPSLLALANMPPPQDYDEEGHPIEPPWPEAKASVASDMATRHKIIEITNLRMLSDTEAMYAAMSMMQQLSNPKLEVSRLRLYPHFDEQQFDSLLELRMQDHVLTIRNLLHSGRGSVVGQNGRRIEIDSLVEGFEYRLTPATNAKQDVHGLTCTWDVVLVLSPLVADVLDIEIPPPATTTPTAQWTLARNGQHVSGTTDTTHIDETARRIYFSFRTNGPKPTVSNCFMVAVHADLVTRQEVDFQQLTATAAGNEWIGYGWVPLDSMLSGRSFQWRVQDVKGNQSNMITMGTPHVVPPKPSIARQSAWEAGLPAGSTKAPTGLTWPHTQGARYDVGRADSRGGTLRVIRSNQAGTSHFEELELDHDYDYAVRFSGTTTWGPRLKIRTGHPASITINRGASPTSPIKLGQSPTETFNSLWASQPGPTFTMWGGTPQPKPPGPNSTGDAWPVNPAVTYNVERMFQADGRTPGGFIGCRVEQLKLFLEARGPGTTNKLLDDRMDNTKENRHMMQWLKGWLLDPEVWKTDITNVQNPSYEGTRTRKTVQIAHYVTDGVPPGAPAGVDAAHARDNRFGIHFYGQGWAPNSGAHIVGRIEVWGTIAEGTNFERNKVIP